MTRNRSLLRTGLGALACAAVLAGCNRHPRYAPYSSPFGDYRCEVPWGWRVASDLSGDDYANLTFLGPFDPLFYRGAPSLSVRWHRVGVTHRLPDGSYETYSSADDYARQMLRDVYGPDGKRWASIDKELSEALARGEAVPETERIRVSGREAEYFVVYRDLPAPKGQVYGVAMDNKGRREVLQRHAYAFLPAAGGFYVLVYPATLGGFEKYKPSFFHLLKTFQLLHEGPVASAPARAAAPAAPSKPALPRRR